jgi:hypothetical protein
MRAGNWLFLLLSGLALPAGAVPQATVEAVQMPAWFSRDGRLQPLAPGQELRNGDVVNTGEGARATLRLAEGSAVKLGQGARMTFYSRSANPVRYFRGALDIATGAFRYTTGLLRRAAGRDLTVRVGTATIGIRGTDVWGRSSDQEDLVCLLEGQVEIQHQGQTTTLDRPLAFFVAPKGQPANPVGQVEPEKVQRWARETEIEPGDGALRQGGRWSLQVGSFTAQAEALGRYDQLRAAGYPARIRTVPAGEGGWGYEVLLSGFPSVQEATVAARWLKQRSGLDAVPLR